MNLTRIILALSLVYGTPISASEAIGYYSSGKLKESESISDKGPIVHKLFLARQRFFGTKEIQNVISDSADYLRQEIPNAELLQVGDIANKNGGSTREHASHQNGLDVDIVYLTKNGKLQSQNAAYWEEDFVKKGVVSANFHTERNLLLFKHLVMTQPVGRIFVDEAIKKHLCSYAQKNNLLSDPEISETLRRIRVEKLHSTHFHLRLKCPTTDLSCKNQAEVPLGTGC